MEKFIKGVFVTLGFIMALFLTLMIGKATYSEYFGDTAHYEQYIPDSVGVPHQTPIVFTTVDEALVTHEYLIGETTANDVFVAMSPEWVKDISSKLIVQKGNCTIDDIATEYLYRTNRDGNNNSLTPPSMPDESTESKAPDERFEPLDNQTTKIDSSKTPPAV